MVGARVITVVSYLILETFPAASRAQAYRVFDPSDENRYDVGAFDVHDPETGDGVVDVSVSK